MNQRPRPIRVATAVLTGVVTLALAVIPMLQLFGVITWTAEQTGAVQFAIGAFSTGVAGVILAFSTESAVLSRLQKMVGVDPVEGRVTPGSDPMTDAGTPLVPTADDGYED